MRILLVEDESKVASFIQKGLEEEQYQVDVAHDGEEGLRRALASEHDLRDETGSSGLLRGLAPRDHFGFRPVT